MATPAIQTLLTDAQQVLNLNSLSEVRATMAAAIANANVGTPLNPNLTTQQLWDEFYLIVRQPESDIESIITNQLMKFLYAPPAPGGAGADKQVIFNDGGVLAGNANFLWNKTTNLLTVTGSATITGDLTVDTNTLKVDSANNRVGILTASPLYALDVRGTIAGGNGTIFGGVTFSSRTEIGALSNHDVGIIANSVTQYLISTGGNHTWYNGGSTAMTLNSTGLGVGGTPVSGVLLTVGSTSSVSATANAFQILSNKATFVVTSDGATNGAGTTINYSWANGGQGPLIFRNASIANVMSLDSSGNVGIGITPSAWGGSYKALDLSSTAGISNAGGTMDVTQNAYNNGTNWIYKTAAAASFYRQQSGVHYWFRGTDVSPSAGGTVTFATAMMLSSAGSLVIGSAAVATTATDGFLYIPSCAGAPTGTPTAQTGRTPMVVDSTNNRFYVYVNGAWKYATLT